MPFISVIYANDSDLLQDINGILAKHVEEIEEPTEVEFPAALDLDFATMAPHVWQVLVVFGSIKASIESIELIVKLLRERKTAGKTSRIEFTVPSGGKITLEGGMTPEDLAKEVKRYQTAFEHTEGAPTP